MEKPDGLSAIECTWCCDTLQQPPSDMANTWNLCCVANWQWYIQYTPSKTNSWQIRPSVIAARPKQISFVSKITTELIGIGWYAVGNLLYAIKRVMPTIRGISLWTHPRPPDNGRLQHAWTHDGMVTSNNYSRSYYIFSF